MVLRIYYVYNKRMNIMNLLYFFTNKSYRSGLITKIFHDKDVHQTSPVTCMNRYPETFELCKSYFNGNSNLNILSFGCCTGEEVLTLREYFPNANIVGAEINKFCLKECNNLTVDDKISFIESTDTNIKNNGPYDAIFCMAVLERTPQRVINNKITSLKKIYPFEKFEEQVIKLDSSLNNGGLLVIENTHYRLSDTSVANNYYQYGSRIHQTSIFDKNSELIDYNLDVNPINVKH